MPALPYFTAIKQYALWLAQQTRRIPAGPVLLDLNPFDPATPKNIVLRAIPQIPDLHPYLFIYNYMDNNNIPYVILLRNRLAGNRIEYILHYKPNTPMDASYGMRQGIPDMPRDWHITDIRHYQVVLLIKPLVTLPKEITYN